MDDNIFRWPSIRRLREEILRNIYGPFCDRGECRIRWNQELYDIYDDIDVVKRIKVQRLRWLGHVARVDPVPTQFVVFESEPAGGSCRKGRPSQRWSDQLTENVTTLRMRNWRTLMFGVVI